MDKKDKNWIGPITCPVCQRPKFYINLNVGGYICFYIGKDHPYHIYKFGELKGSGISNLPQLFGLSTIAELRQYIKNYKKSNIATRKAIEPIQSKLTLKIAFEKLPKLSSIKSVMDFCKRKNITKEYWDDIYLDFDYHAGFRLIIPIYQEEYEPIKNNENNLFNRKKPDKIKKYVGYQARSIVNNDKVKDLTPGLRNLEIVYNLDYVKEKGRSTVLVCESVFDTFIDRSRIVSIFNHTLGDVQKNLLLSSFNTIILCFDGNANMDARRYAYDLGNNGWYLKIDDDNELDDIKHILYQQTCVNPSLGIEKRLDVLIDKD